VQGADGDARAAALAGAIVALGDSLDIATVAEGIETEQQASSLRELECPIGQGYLFARPLPPEELDGLLEADVSL
jgi:EAL domain-containing protein (putative c-di-GMP-specific phosphodiesterase class I)